MNHSASTLKEGDIFYIRHDEDYHVLKLLVHEAQFETYHVLIYEPVRTLPTVAELADLQVSVYHSPFAKEAFKEPIVIVNRPVTAADLIGYHEYLRQTRAPEDWIPIANGYYNTAYDLTDQNLHLEAIDFYSKSIDLFPQFYEAIDNRAFCKMDLGRWDEAISDFRLSLEQNPESILAEFSIGECHLKKQEYLQAKAQFEIALRIEPGNALVLEFLGKVNGLLGGEG